MAGAACARALTDAGVTVRVLERGRAPGGRMASPAIDGRRVDMGAAYFTVTDDAFRRVVTLWQNCGLARPWTSGFDSVPPRPSSRPAEHGGPVRWAATDGSRSLVRHLLDGVDLRLEHEAGGVSLHPDGPRVDGVPAEIVVLAVPDPQARRLLAPLSALDELRARLSVPFDPVIAVMLGWDEREWSFADGCFVNDDPMLTFVADDGARRGDGSPVLVAHTTADLARDHLWDPTAAIEPVLDRLRGLFGIRSAPVWTRAHRWGIAKPAAAHAEAFGWYDAGDGRGIGVIGDSWCPSGSPRVESAWLSGTALAEHLLSAGAAALGG